MPERCLEAILGWQQQAAGRLDTAPAACQQRPASPLAGQRPRSNSRRSLLDSLYNAALAAHTKLHINPSVITQVFKLAVLENRAESKISKKIPMFIVNAWGELC